MHGRREFFEIERMHLEVLHIEDSPSCWTMIYAKDTPNHVGITLYGDNLDFQNLYEAVGELLGVGDPELESEVHTRILALNYDLRHAMQGDHET